MRNSSPKQRANEEATRPKRNGCSLIRSIAARIFWPSPQTWPKKRDVRSCVIRRSQGSLYWQCMPNALNRGQTRGQQGRKETAPHKANAPATPAANALPATPAATPKEPHPQIREALAALRRAKEHMEHAAHDFGGHRVEAIEATNKAIEQLELCLNSTRAKLPEAVHRSSQTNLYKKTRAPIRHGSFISRKDV